MEMIECCVEYCRLLEVNLVFSIRIPSYYWERLGCATTEKRKTLWDNEQWSGTESIHLFMAESDDKFSGCNNAVHRELTKLGNNMLLPLRTNEAQQNLGLIDSVYRPKSKCKDLA